MNPTEPRVSLAKSAWDQIDHLLAELPFRVAAPVVSAIQQTGGVLEVPPEPHDVPEVPKED